MKMSFITDLKKDINSSLGYTEEVVKLSALKLFYAIVGKTPVDTGHLAYNWQLSIDKPKEQEIKGVDKDKHITIRKAESSIGKYSIKKTKQIWITNCVEYAYDIEYKGKSRLKAPAGMVRVSLREWNFIMKNSTTEINRGTGATREL